MFTIGLVNTLRGWPQLSPQERQLQISLLIGLATPVFAIFFRPRFYFKWAGLSNVMARASIPCLPTSIHLMSMLLNGESRIGKRWAASPIGALGIVIFTSRTLALFAAAGRTQLTFWRTVLAQTIVLAAGYVVAPDICTAVVAEAPFVVSFLRNVHDIFSSIWIIIVRFPLSSAVPSQLVHPGTSLLAITLFVMMLSYLAPIVYSAARAAAAYKEYRLAWENRHWGVRRRGRRLPPSFPVKMVLCFESLYDFPIHLAWFAISLLCMLWMACYAAAHYHCLKSA